jgi:hypothetical protein
MPGRVVQAKSVGRFFLDQQEATVLLYHGGDSNIGFPAGAHAPLWKGLVYLGAI